MKRIHDRSWLFAATVALTVFLAGCASLSKDQRPLDELAVGPVAADRAQRQAVPEERIAEHGDSSAYEEDNGPEIEVGSGQFVNVDVASRRLPPPPEDGEITFNFEASPIQEVVKTILGDLLQENYVISPGLSGQVTFATAKPVKMDQVMPILEMLLSWNNSALVYVDGRYNVVPRQQAIPGHLTPRIGGTNAQRGFEVRAVPLEYIAAAEMEKLLKPYARDGGIISVDPLRNMIVIGGNQRELNNYLQTIATFDVDWLAGMSVGIFPIDAVDVATIVGELESVFGEGATTPLAGMFRFLPLERLNAVMVITPQPKYLAEAEEWIGRLDRGSETSGTRLYVYDVKNVKAVDLADTLNDAFGGGGGGSTRTTSSRSASNLVTPGLTPVELASASASDRRTAQAAENAAKQDEQQARRRNNRNSRDTGGFSTAAVGEGAVVASDGNVGLLLIEDEEISITAVEESNALLIRATPLQYEAVLGAIKRLDTTPLQVLLEAQILEVTLQGSLNYGVRWFFESAANSIPGLPTVPDSGGSTKDLFNLEAGQLTSGGLSYAFGNVGSVTGLLTALESESQVRVLSSPSLLVLNNKEASINVGTQIPVTQTFVGNLGSNDFQQRGSVQFRDTGVILSVTPRVNPGGLVFLEISQEFSTPIEGSADTNGNVSVNRRTLDTEIWAQTGQTIILGGLISNRGSELNDGLPFFSRIPIVGGLFGAKSYVNERTELLVMITPTVVRSIEEAELVTDEYQRKFRGLEPLNLPVETPGDNTVEN